MDNYIKKESLRIKEIDYNTSKLVTISNLMITAKQAMTLNEAKLLRIIMMQISKDKEGLEYTININRLAKMLGVSSSNLYRDIRKICYRLETRTIQIKTGERNNPYQIFSWLSMSEYDEKGRIHIVLNNVIESYIMQRYGLSTQYKIQNILALTSYYAIRIYEILKMYFEKTLKKQYHVLLSLKELREMTDTINKYTKNTDFKLRVLDYAKREINNKTDLRIEYELKKTGRKYSHVEFTVYENIK